MITLNDRFAGSFDVAPYQEIVTKIHRMIHDKTGAGNDFLGWVDWALNYDEEEFARMIDVAERLKDRTDVVVVCGIGGSYLGARAAIEMIKGLYPSTGPEIIFAGNTFSGTYIKQVMDYIKDKRTVVNVISKSGTTTETALAFRILRAHMEEKYGKEGARERILCTTDKARGVLKELADREGYETFVIPDDIGGRYSGLTAVGLLPMALAGINIREVMKGFLKANHDLNTDDLKVNDAYRYAVERRILQARGYDVEMYVSYEMQMRSYMEWLKQLFGESEGKKGKGILPDSVIFSTDLHSLGQFIQEDKKVLFETVIEVKDPGCA
ncbi:MAG: glucose-6-phosphate isomerase, partial [Solobacterium sp.]|nr:glucose-6-phosphate isomerase [Solobacterium sp.]